MTSKPASRGWGYSQRVIAAVMAGDPKHPGVALGRFCIKHDVPVAEVAREVGVSRWTVYQWFTEKSWPSVEAQERFRALVAARSVK